MVFKNLQAPDEAEWKFLPRASGGRVDLASCQGWQVHGMDLGR